MLDFERDTVYRFLNASCINWAMYLLKFAVTVIKPIKVATSEDRLCALVVDDSLFSRRRSRCVELLANVHDHASHGKKEIRPWLQNAYLGLDRRCKFHSVDV